MSNLTISPFPKAVEHNLSSASSQKEQQNRGSRRTRRLGMAWVRRYTHYYRDPAILTLLQECGHAALTWLDMILLHLASLWEAEGEQGLEYTIRYWLEQVCMLKREDWPTFERFLAKAHELGLLIVERKGDELKISSPDLMALADDYTRKKRRKQEKQGEKKETTRARLARLEEQVTKLTETVTRLVDALQGRAPASASPAPAAEAEEEPSEEEKQQILQEFEKKFSLTTNNWRKAVILLVFPPKTPPGPGYLAKMTDLSQASRALAAWRERKKTQIAPEKLEKIEEAKVYAEMVRQGFDFQQIPVEIAGLVQKILKKGGNGHVRV